MREGWYESLDVFGRISGGGGNTGEPGVMAAVVGTYGMDQGRKNFVRKQSSLHLQILIVAKVMDPPLPQYDPGDLVEGSADVCDWCWVAQYQVGVSEGGKQTPFRRRRLLRRLESLQRYDYSLRSTPDSGTVESRTQARGDHRHQFQICCLSVAAKGGQFGNLYFLTGL